ncbi:hypothetical protein [Halegenticoccus tardaugens]|uniref:hypothetical protein n=1 Tax=Halegenticoccus tardaugens TaxID=2071624 RepID=UPI00100BBA2F|nr:hypothetical protein [Halegenticoccus tardaugens]
MPTPPDTLPKYLAEGLGNQSPDTLKDIIEYAQKLRDDKQHQKAVKDQRRRNKSDQYTDQLQEQDVSANPSDYDAVPANAYVTIKRIDDWQYYYWQWREDGSTWASKYIAPVNTRD